MIDDKVRIAAVDFDGTLDHGAYPDRFAIDEFAVSVLRAFRANGGRVILWTVRCGEALELAVQALSQAGLEVDAVNSNLEDTVAWMDVNVAMGPSPKVYADVYIDDRAAVDGRVNWCTWAHKLGVW